MNSKLVFHNEENRIKIDNLKNINLSEIINKKKKFKGFRESKDAQNMNQKPKKMNKIFNKINNISKRINTNQINKNPKISNLSIDLFPDKPMKIKEDLYKNKTKFKRNLSNRKFYPKKFIKMISELTENNNYLRKAKKTKSFNKTKKDKINLCKKILEGNLYIAYNAGIPLMDFEKSKRKKKYLNNTLKEKNININTNNNNPTKKDNLSFNQKNYFIQNNTNIVSKPQCLYKGPLKYDMSIGEDDIYNNINNNNNHSLFKVFMSRNLKQTKQDNILNKENINKDSQACTFIKYDVNGTMKTKRIFNSTFHIYDNDKDKDNKIRKEIVTTMNNYNNISGKINNKKKRTFGGIMFNNKAKLF